MKTIQRASITWLIAGATLVVAYSASAQAQSTATASQSRAGNSVRIYIDPATGRTRPATSAERAEEAIQSAEEAKLRKGRGVKYSRRADGTLRALDLEGRLMQTVVVTINADGSLSYRHAGADPSKVQPVAPTTRLEEK